MGALKAKICLKNGLKIIALLNTVAEIHIMIRKLIKDANLAMRQGLKLEFISYTNDSPSFFGFFKDIKITIKKFKIRHQIFMVEI